jgi:hypothetical protein
MKCEYFKCDKKTRVNLFGLVWLCKRHAKQVISEFKQRWLCKRHAKQVISEFKQRFKGVIE